MLCSLSFEGLPIYVAVGSAALISGAFVLSLYLVPSRHGRDHPTTAMQRVIAVTSVTLLSPVVLYAVSHPAVDGECLWELIGFKFPFFQSVGVSLALSATLFAGPLLQQCLHGFDIPDLDILFVRNLIAAPIAEEVVFRGCLVPLLLPCFGTKAIFIAPLFFGVAHLHHYFSGIPFPVVAFQFLYTSVFGAFSAALFVRTGTILGPIVSHAFCNFMGFPAFGEAASSPHRWLLLGTYVGGLVAFGMLFMPLTGQSLFPRVRIA